MRAAISGPDITGPEATRRAPWAWPLAMSFLRIPLMLLGALLVWGLLAASGQARWFWLPLGTSVAMNFVNLVCLGLLARLLRREGTRLRDVLGFDRTRLGRDLLWGVCWLVVLNGAYIVALMVPLLIVSGPAGFADGSVFQQAFVGGWDDLPGDAFGPVTMALLSLWMLAFPFLNAPVEELQYRGYAQPRLHAATGRAWVGVSVPAIGFGLQHVLFAPSWLGVVAYTGAFMVWGAGAGLIYLRQARLMPLVLAHFVTNLPVMFVAVAFLLRL